jgi:hypothetical protein
MGTFNKHNNRGQTSLILILLAAAALIFLAISLNWGRISQTKATLSIAADQAAALMASDVASYGEMQKQTNLNDTNQITGMTGLVFDIIMILVIIIVTILTWGTATALTVMLFVALAAAIATAVLQLTVIQPGMDSMWNKLQANQPISQQFFEQAVGSALQGSVTDQVNITDYFDSNANGQFGTSSNDSVSRFAFYYTERLKMLDKGDIPQVDFFYNQLNGFLGGETCAQNFYDHQTTQGIPINPSCIDPSSGSAETNYCGADPTSPNSSDPACSNQIPTTISCTQNVYENTYLTDPANPDSKVPLNSLCQACSDTPSDPSCQTQVPNEFSFQLNDSCTDSNPTLSGYNPYCDACCQPMAALVGKAADGSPKYQALRP